MQSPLFLFNTLTRKKEEFRPLHPPFAGMYVCGPTVYSDVHLGNCRTFISFDMIYRYLVHLGYKVRYVRNITDAGHLEGDRDEGEDKFAKRARLEQLEPMEIVQKYTLGFRDIMSLFNNRHPSIEPTATGHLVEQIEMTKAILDAGYAYERNGTVYFDVEKFSMKHNYGILSNRNLDDLLANTRELGGQDEKKGRLDFALWIKAKPEHIMRWPSPWGEGFPGWHIECSAMSTKYLGEVFDIHGGGMDLIATHHTNEIAQSMACSGKAPVRYWMHTNMLTVNSVRMSKSAGNGFLPMELFTGAHPLLEQPYSPMTVRFFMMQTHYRSTLDFSNEALKASEKGFGRLMNAMRTLEGLTPSQKSSFSPEEIAEKVYGAMNDDFNTPVALAALFDGVRLINSTKDGKESLDGQGLEKLKKLYHSMVYDVMGLKEEQSEGKTNGVFNGVMDLLISLRNEAKEKKDFPTSDRIRDSLKELNIGIRDTKEGSTWEVKE